MKPNELMIGDWVVYDGDTEYIYPVNIEAIDIAGMCVTSDREDVGFDGVQPIPLTAEILENNGFVKDKTQDGGDFYEFWSEDLEYCIYLYLYGVYFFLFDNINMQIKYVHELQHALRLCNIDKEIEL